LTDFVRFSLKKQKHGISKTPQQYSTHKLDPDEIREAMTQSQEIPETNDNL
jgi:hypothetical protein